MSTSLRQAPLTQAKAESRFSHFANTPDNLSYNLFLKFHRGETYEGHVIAHFDLQKTSSDFFIDWAGTELKELTINGTKIENPESIRNDRFITLPEANLKVGKNELKIVFKNNYARNGQGLHSFIDTDTKQYIYSELEPYYCNKFFPCFDQPDLKAPMDLIVASPKEWNIVANNPIDDEASKKLNVSEYLTTEEQANYKLEVHTRTPKISSYLYCVCGGDYQEIKCTDLYNNISMSVFARESLMPYLKEQANEIFLIHKESIKFYENYFGIPYPFGKCDAIFATEYNMGAMENPGLIVYNDRFIWKEKVPKDMNTMRANVIAHEVAHQWFGNLVTMKWWNDLWLNESFAEFISHYCQSKIWKTLVEHGVEHIDPWAANHLRKERGYNEDQLITTHPIAGEVKDTDMAKAIFDGITYNKGAATIRQLMGLIGEENFGKALNGYFTKHAWGNTTLDDFIGALQEYYKPNIANAPSSLNEWKAEWLETAGLNKGEPVWDPKDTSSNAKLTILQSAVLPEYPTCRHHKLKVAFFDENANVAECKDIITKNSGETVIEYDGSKKPKAVLLNYQDEGFIKVSIDPSSLAFFKENIVKLPGEMTRILVWRAIYEMARDGHISAYEYTNLASHSLPLEESTIVIRFILFFSNLLVGLVPKVLKNNYILPELFEALIKTLKKSDQSDAGRIVMLKDHIILYATYGEEAKVDNISRLISWFDGTDKDLKDYELTVKNKWAIVEKIHMYPRVYESTQLQYFQKVAELDKSDEMKRNEKKLEAMRADSKARKQLWETFLDPNDKTSLHMMSEAMRGYRLSLRNNEEDEKLFFDNVLKVYETKDAFFARAFVAELFPQGDNVAYYLERLNEIKDKATNALLKKQIGEYKDQLERKKKCYSACAPDILRLSFNIHI